MSHHHHRQQGNASGGSAAIFEPETPWFNAKFPVKKCTIKDIAIFSITQEQIADHYRAAQAAMERETERLGALDHKRWAMDHFQQKGTVADRIASAALELSDPCLLTTRRLNAFTVLFDIAQHDSHHFESALNAISAVWPRLLPPRPLRKFAAQYFATLPDDETKRDYVLAHWLLEDSLKRTYAQFLTLAETCLKDRLATRREAWLSTCGRLLPRCTEGRPALIALIVDKLGDPNKAMAHKAYHQLLDMLCESSTYQSVLLTELEKLALEKSATPKAQAYCVQVLAQFVFNKDEQKLALKVIDVYLALLRQQLAAGAAEYSSTTAIIVGMRRAFPYAGTNFAVLEEHVDTLFALSATGPFLQRVHALSLVHQLFTKGWKTLEHRYYRALYGSLMVPSAQLPHSSQLAGYFTLLFKSLRADAVPERVAAFVHRMLQQCAFHNEAFACSMLLMVGEFSRVSPLVANLLTQAATAANKKKQQQQQQQQQQLPTSPSGNGARPTEYDAKQRDPRFAGAAEAHACYWQLSLLAAHAHPSVARLAKSLLAGDVVAFDVHPLDDLTLTHFLDMVTEGKTTEKKRPESEGKGVPVFHRNAHVPVLPKASDATFAKAHPAAVDPGALFLHRFAHQRLKFMHAAKPRWHDDDDDPLLKLQEVPAAGSAAAAAKAKREDVGLFGPRPTVGQAVVAQQGQSQQGQQHKKNKEEQQYEDDMVEFNWGRIGGGSDNEEEEEDGGAQDDDFAFHGGRRGGDDDEDEEDEDEAAGGNLFGQMGDFDEELQHTEARETDRRRQRDQAWLDRATGEGPKSPFNSAGTKHGGGGRQQKSQQQQQQRQGGGAVRRRRG